MKVKKLLGIILAASMAVQAGIVSFADVSYMADFETAKTKFGSSTTYGGFKNSAQDYNDYIKPEWVEGEGVDGSTGLEISYRAATWYAGEVFFPMPAVWIDKSGAEYLAFDCKGSGTVKINLSTGNKDDGTLTSGTRYEYRLSVDSEDDWEHFCIPLASFKNSGASVDISKVYSVTFQAGENGNLNNNADATKNMTADELNDKARTGSVIFDNMELTDDGSGAVTEPTPEPVPTANPGGETTDVIDFDTYSLSHKQTWGGFKNGAGDYSDCIETSVTENGKDGNGFEITYRAATWYAGEAFLEVPSKWNVDGGAKYIEFEANGRGVIKMALETGNVVNGTRYERKLSIDTKGEWRKYSIPVSEFQKSGASVNLADVVGITFTAAENGGLNNNAAETKAMSSEELTAKAKTGSIVMDNITLSEACTLDPKTTASVWQDGEELSSVKNAADGGLDIKVSMTGYNGEQEAVVLAGLYDEEGMLCDIALAECDAHGELTLSVYINGAAGKYIKVFTFDAFDSMVPLHGAVKLN